MISKLPFHFAVVITLIFFTTLPAPLLAAEKAAQKAVLVTGASTGIGRRITEVFAADGYFVYAGARKQKDIDSLNELENVLAIELDVTVQEQIDAAVQTITKEGRGLWGLINNAGVYIGGPIADVDVAEYQWLMDVNVTGVYRMTQAFAPMIIESGGRISTVGSISGINSGRFNGAYSMSKHAIEAFTDSLAAEMAMVGVKVSVIEPGNYASAIGKTAQERMVRKKDAYENQGSPFADKYGEWISGSWGRDQYKEPDEVADAALHAMFAEEPLVRYMVVPAEPEAAWAIDKLIEEVVQLNQWHAYTYSRDELVAKLDAASVSQADIDEITELLNSFLANSGKAEAHERFWAGDLVYTSSDGSRTSKNEIMQSFSDGEEKESLSTTVYSGEEINVQLFGTTAVVTFKLVGTPDDGSPALNYFNTGTFLKRNGEWRAVAWQATVIPQG